MLFGTMGEIGPVALHYLNSVGVEARLVPFPQTVFRDESGYRRELLKALAQYSCTHILPIGNPVALSRFKAELMRLYPDVTPLVEDPQKVELLDSKLQSYEYFRSLGVPVPQSFPSADDVPDGVRTVFKRDVSFGGQGVRLPSDICGLRNLIRTQGASGPYMIQRFIPGAEYSVDALRLPASSLPDSCSGAAPSFVKDSCSGSHVILASSYSRRQTLLGAAERESHPGNPVDAARRTLCSMPQLEDIAAKVLDALDYTGVCGFDFIISSEDGLPYLLEANPRLTGGLATQLSGAFPILLMLIRGQCGRTSGTED